MLAFKIFENRCEVFQPLAHRIAEKWPFRQVKS